MYPIRLIVVGRLKQEGCKLLERHYLDLLRAYARVDVIEVADSRAPMPRLLREEADRILTALQGATVPVLLDAEAPSRSSEAFARWLGDHLDRGSHLGFVIGSSHGVDPSLKQAIREKLSLSPMTFPHDLVRPMFLEQLYRAFTIRAGKTYHK